MIVHVPFYSEKKFRDDQNFPYGFAKSGVFNCEQAALIENHGHAYVALATAQREPKCAEEHSFVAVCEGKKDVETVHERTWKRYLATVESKRYLSHGYVSESVSPSTVDNQITDFEDAPDMELGNEES